VTVRRLHGYQRSAVNWLLDNPEGGLLADLGLGKTAIMLDLLASLKLVWDLRRALVIGPLRVVNATWPDEIAAWRVPLSWSIIGGSAAQRQAAMEEPTDLHLVNRENVAWLVGQHVKKVKGKWTLVKPWPYDVVIVDELTSFGDSQSERFKTLARVRSQIKRFHGMTATPAAEGYMKTFAMTYLHDRGARFGKGVTAFRERYFNQNPYTRQWTLRDGADEEILAKLQGAFLVMRADDHLPRDKPTYINRRVHLTDAEMAQYKAFERDFFTETRDGTVVEAVHAAALATKMLQLSSGFIYDADRRAHWFHDHKIDELRQLAEEAEGENLIVAYWFKPSLAKLQKAFPHAVVMDREGKALRDWNSGKTRMLLMHPMSAGFGLNAQFGGATIVFFDIPAPYEAYFQMIGRVDRQGQIRPVKVYHLVAADTDDELVAVPRLAAKKNVSDYYLDRLKSI